MKIVSIVGARPQFIKLAPLDKTLREDHDHVIVHTGQHYNYEMSRAFFDELDIPEPDYNLEIGSGTHAWQTGQMLSALGETLPGIALDLVLVYGDTNSTLAGALAAVKLHLPVAHVESGYRSFDISMPEEVNRLLVDRVAQMLFAPTEDAVDNLVAEGVSRNRIFLVGNIMAESLLGHLDQVKANNILDDLGVVPKSYAVLTVHRPENTDDRGRITAIIEAVIAADFPVLFPVHPRAAQLLDDFGLTRRMNESRIRRLPPMKYLEFAKVQSEAAVILTDSGGMQEEALLLDVPCLTLRYNTERVLTLKLGGNQLVGADGDKITAAFRDLIARPPAISARPLNWDTEVSIRILAAINAGGELLKIGPQSGLM